MYKPFKLLNFKLHELIGPRTMELIGSNAWSILDKELLLDIDKFVTDIKLELNCKAVTINNWKWGGKYTQSGFREADSTTGTLKSMHRQGRAFDLKFKGITTKQAFDYLIENQSKYPAIKRVEDLRDAPTWLHVDSKETELDRIYVFRV